MKDKIDTAEGRALYSRRLGIVVRANPIKKSGIESDDRDVRG